MRTFFSSEAMGCFYGKDYFLTKLFSSSILKLTSLVYKAYMLMTGAYFHFLNGKSEICQSVDLLGEK